MINRKKKLETSLEGLFSRPKADKDIPSPEAEETPTPSLPKSAEKKSKPAVKKAPAGKTPAKPAAGKKAASTAAKVPEEIVKEVLSPDIKPSLQADEKTVTLPAAEPVMETPSAQVERPEPQISEPENKVSENRPSEAAIVPAENKTLAVKAVEEEEGDIQILVFEINHVAYGIDVSMVQTIIKPQAVFLVPGTVEYLKGLINLRGAVVPVIDMRTRFDLPEKEIDKDTRFVVVEIEDIMASMVVDMVHGVQTFPLSVVEKPSGLVMDVDNRYLTGMARQDDKIILILDLLQAIRPEKAEQR